MAANSKARLVPFFGEATIDFRAGQHKRGCYVAATELINNAEGFSIFCFREKRKGCRGGAGDEVTKRGVLIVFSLSLSLSLSSFDMRRVF